MAGKQSFQDLRPTTAAQRHWRAVEEAWRDEGNRAEPEFSPDADGAPDALTRRVFLRLAGASLALAGGAACERTPEKILPYTVAPPELTPGLPLHFATSLVLDGAAAGLLVQSHEGRPTKVEGNPAHPASLGAAGVFEQASVLGVYDPQRANRVVHSGRPGAYPAFVRAVAGLIEGDGSRVRFLMPPQSSPQLAASIAAIKGRLPGARFTFYSPVRFENATLGAAAAFGRKLQPLYDITQASVIVALDSDFLTQEPMHLALARAFANRRVPDAPLGMNRMYAAEAALTVTGSNADHRLAVRSSDIAKLAVAIHARLRGLQPPELPTKRAAWVKAIAGDLERARGAGLVLAGDRQPPSVHAITHAINALLGNMGRTVRFIEPTLLDGDESLSELVAEMRAGSVETLVMLQSDPVLNAPADLEFREALRRVRHAIAVDLYRSQTALACEWFIPAAHFLESWGDARAYDGTVSFVQPLISPRFEGRTECEILALFAGQSGGSSYELLRDFWRTQSGFDDEREHEWQRAIQLGLIPESQAAPVDAALRSDFVPAPPPEAPAEQLEMNFVASPTLYDGRFASNVWLLELPHPVHKLCWDNALLVGPELAQRLGLENEQVVRLRYRNRALKAPVFIAPGHADRSVTLELGWGQSGSEDLPGPIGFDANRIRTSEQPAFGVSATLEPTDQHYPLARTQTHWSLHGRPIALSVALAEYEAGRNPAERSRGPLASLLPRYESSGPQWAMSIDLSRCIGCQGCVVACQAENNVPVVGKPGVLKSREMHWLRIDTYYEGAPEAPDVAIHQPMLCQHCEKAPCEYVCPVFATVHSPDGLNEMVYNRCIGTRFCSNNCPYKVRRFNWFDYVDRSAHLLQRNPQVTVRERGVMEKCTYCVQRIRVTSLRARVERRALREGEIQTACEQACPTQAIVFGDTTRPQSRVTTLRRDPRRYQVLHEQGTRPRTEYLLRLQNPHPRIV
jgi:Fe-S-cluster-containing dehydrogenase component